MKGNVSLLAHAILAVGGLTLAYMVWTDTSPEVREDEITIFECDPDQITRAELHEEQKDTVLEVRRENGERVIWVTVTRRPEHGEATHERFVGSEGAGEYLSKIAPMRALRSLGTLDDHQLGEVELRAPESRLSLRCGSRTASFDLGARAYGTGDRYARAHGTGPVYLVQADRLQGLESAEFRLMQRDLHTFQPREIVAVRVRGEGRDKRLLQHNRLDEERAEWVDSTDPERRNELYGNWLVRFTRLRVQSYLDRDGAPGSDLDDAISVAPVSVLRLDYEGEHGTLGFLELQRVDAQQPAYYVRTETTRSWVRVPTSVAQEIEEDFRPVVGLEPRERPQPDAGAPDAGAPDAGAAATLAPPTPAPPLPEE